MNRRNFFSELRRRNVYKVAVAYAVAENLGFTKEQVTWVVVPFNSSYAPGDKNFDFDINQISITPERQQVVDFSDGYYAVQQAVVAIEGTPGAEAATIEKIASTTPAAPSRCPVIDLVELTATLREWSPSARLIAIVSARSPSSVEVACALM